MLPTPGEHSLATILKHDSKTTSYKIALLRALNDLVLSYPGLAQLEQPVAVPLMRIAELWAAYYWPFMGPQPIYQGPRALLRNDVSFRPALTQLRAEWQRTLLTPAEPADGFFLFTEMRTPRRRATYPVPLVRAYEQALTAITAAIRKPIQYAGPEQWVLFPQPARFSHLAGRALPLPGTTPTDVCVVVAAPLWQAFHRLSLYVEALCIHEWCLFTEGVTQDATTPSLTRGHIYTLLTARPDNRRPLSWERNQVDILLHEQVSFTCPWTQKIIAHSTPYDLDHLLPLAIYPLNELWNLLPVDPEFNQRTKRDRVPSMQRLAAAEPLFAAAYASYGQSATLSQAMHTDAALRFTGLTNTPSFARDLARHTVSFINNVSDARYVTRF
ncbi:HNH endonuclease domain-containing protein [Hymenobacter cheonanensis]|uniref:HNH endonuclease domain-containing protein n=1 Tax=Hymenobacter sp. CA2-7 TaxID=3063993 RepID=UPI0027133277|nr:HNH endonuclease domain-containing protein [Hymenobacter sp. CA2-7]MDO7884307.1 HNH endonuclease domain-containing protein [Hymenobacter sp. CA2-7]